MGVPCDLVLGAHLRVVHIHGRRGIAAQSHGAYTCVWEFSDDGGAIEWEPTRELHVRASGGGSFAGRWVAIGDDLQLTITRALEVTGGAVWHGYGDNTHEGAVHGTGHVAHGLLTVDDDPCEVRARRVGDYLVVIDNRECGGVNVAFDGVYRRLPPGAPTPDVTSDE